MKTNEKHPFLFIAFVLCACLFLTSCFPTIESDFLPVPVADGDILDGHCPPTPRSVAVFQRQGITVSVRSGFSSTDSAQLRFAYELPEGKIIRFTDTNLKLLRINSPPLLIDLDRPSSIFWANKELRGATISREALASKGEGTLYSPREGSIAKTRFKLFEASAAIPEITHAEFTISLPPFEVNGVVVPPLLVTFKRANIGYVTYFNC